MTYRAEMTNGDRIYEIGVFLDRKRAYEEGKRRAEKTPGQWKYTVAEFSKGLRTEPKSLLDRSGIT